MVMCLTLCAQRPEALTTASQARVIIKTVTMVRAFFTSVLLHNFAMPLLSACKSCATLVIVQASYAYIKSWTTSVRFAGEVIVLA